MLAFGYGKCAVVGTLFEQYRRFGHRETESGGIHVFLIFGVGMGMLMAVLPRSKCLHFSSGAAVRHQHTRFRLLLQRREGDLLGFSHCPEGIIVIDAQENERLERPIRGRRPVVAFGHVHVGVGVSDRN